MERWESRDMIRDLSDAVTVEDIKWVLLRLIENMAGLSAKIDEER